MVFYGSSVYAMYCFGRLAMKWPKIMRRWESIEAKLPKYRYQSDKRRLANHLRMLSFIVLMCSLGKRKMFSVRFQVNLPISKLENVMLIFSGACFEYCVNCLLLEKMFEPKRTGGRIFQSQSITTLQFCAILTMDCIRWPISECGSYICMELHGLVCYDDQSWFNITIQTN